MYSIVVEQSHTLQSDPLLFQVPTWLHAQLVQHYWLYSLCCTFTSPWLFVLLKFLAFFTQPPQPSLSPGNHQSVLCISGSVLFAHLFCSLHSTCKWYHMVKLHFCFTVCDYSHWMTYMPVGHLYSEGRPTMFKQSSRSHWHIGHATVMEVDEAAKTKWRVTK